MGNDIGTGGKLALAIWRMGVQVRKDSISYIILTFDRQKSFEMRMIALEPNIVTAKEVACRRFPFVNPVEVIIVQPKPSLRDLSRVLNPRKLLKGNYISMASIKPKGLANRLCLCLEVKEDPIKVGLIMETGRTAIASVSKSSVDADSIVELFTSACESVIIGQSSPRTYHDALVSLMDSMKIK